MSDTQEKAKKRHCWPSDSLADVYEYGFDVGVDWQRSNGAIDMNAGHKPPKGFYKFQYKKEAVKEVVEWVRSVESGMHLRSAMEWASEIEKKFNLT